MRLHRVAVALAIAAAFLPLLSNGFVSWDDPEALVDNDALRSPGVVGWAFTTDLMSHFQPLSWLVWSGVERLFGTSAGAFHALSLLAHVSNGVLLYLLLVQLAGNRTAAALGTLLYAVHPLRVEPVAWASAFPYLLATSFLLLATLAYLRSRIALSALAYGASLLARPVALGFPLVLLALDVVPLRRELSRKVLLEKTPFLALAVLGLFLEAARRPFLDLDRFGAGARLSLAGESVVAHVARLLWPIRLTPLDPLPLEPSLDPIALVLGAAILSATGALAWRVRDRFPAALAVWTAWLVLVLPSLGLAPSGLQATADRYSYVPGLAISAGLAVGLARSRAGWRWAAAAAIALLAIATYRQTLWWRDSVTLWGRAAELDPENDLALYFYGSALAEAGRAPEAMSAYRDVIQLVPDHGPARVDLARLAAREGDRIAYSGDLTEAIALYDAALAAVPSNARALESRAMALFELERFDEALPALEAAFEAGASRAEVGVALALLQHAGDDVERAAATLSVTLERFPDAVAPAHNLARLLATRRDLFSTRAAEAVALAERVVSATERKDSRALDTLALALHAAGLTGQALDVFEEAHRAARARGDAALAREIEAHARDVTAANR